MASCMSKLAIIPANTLRGAIVAALTRVTSASNNLITDGCCSTRVGSTTSEVSTAASVSTFAASAGAGGAVVVMMLVWRAAMSKHSGWNRQTRSSAVAQSSEQTSNSVHSWVKQRTCHNRSTPQDTVHRSRTRACQASARNVVCGDGNGRIAVRMELIAHLDC